jgi:predicted phage tail protein
MTATADLRLVPAEYTDVYLAGELGKKFGRKWRLVCRTPVQAIRLIGLARPDFKAHMLKSAAEGMNFHVICDKRSRTEEELKLPAGKRLIISPEVQGAKGNGGSILEVVIGVALVVASIYEGGAAGWGYLSATTATQVAGVGMSIGMSLVLAGITQMLSPQAPGSTASYYFNGASNTVTQGQPVPVVYGEMMVGGLPISSAMSAVDASAAPNETGLLGGSA